jgi:hypothetical protein
MTSKIPPRELLEYEFALLLLRHGRQSVLEALSRRIEMPAEELEALVKNLPQPSRQQKRKRTGSFSIERFVESHPEKADVLRQLHSRFENRTFLPELKDVKRVFDRTSRPFKPLKSREAAIPQLFKLLSELDSRELNRLKEEIPKTPGYSSLGLISDEILRRDK